MKNERAEPFRYQLGIESGGSGGAGIARSCMERGRLWKGKRPEVGLRSKQTLWNRVITSSNAGLRIYYSLVLNVECEKLRLERLASLYHSSHTFQEQLNAIGNLFSSKRYIYLYIYFSYISYYIALAISLPDQSQVSRPISVPEPTIFT